jgi:hypothetical protein
MKEFKFTQPGTFSVALLLPILILTVVMLILYGFDEPPLAIVLIFVIITFIICLLAFYRLTIIISDSRVGFSMGTGLIKKHYPVEDIESCRPVSNPAIYGIGIHWTPDGWLYNVSGRKAIELTFKNRKKIRIGTDRPEEIAALINKMLGNTAINSDRISPVESSGKSGMMILAVVILLGLAFPAIIIQSGRKPMVTTVSDTALNIEGIYGMRIDHSEIKSCDTIVSLPSIKARTNGYAFGKILRGNFRLQTGEKVKLFIDKGNPPFIHIKTVDTDVFLNFDDAALTRILFADIRQKLGERIELAP